MPKVGVVLKPMIIFVVNRQKCPFEPYQHYHIYVLSWQFYIYTFILISSTEMEKSVSLEQIEKLCITISLF